MEIITSPQTWHAPDRTAEEFFWSYVHARQSAWYERFILRSKPYTYDTVLRGYHFTNVYRECDLTTQYVVWQILENEGLAGVWHVTLHALVFRLFGNIETYEEIKVLLENAALGDPDHIEALTNMLAMLERRKGFKVVAQGSAMVGLKSGHTYGLPLNVWMHALTEIFQILPAFMAAMRNGDLRLCYDMLLTITGFGPRKAYNAALDFTYPLLRMKGGKVGKSMYNRGWALVHGNALHGLERLGVKGNDAVLQRAVLAMAVKSDTEVQRRLQLHTADGRTAGLGAHNIVKCLEEWNIYTCISEGRTNARQFKERDTSFWRPDGPTLPAYGGWNESHDRS